MASRRRIGKKLFKSLLPLLLIVLVAGSVAAGFIVYKITRPPRRAYLVTPQSFAQISGTALKVADQTWRNRDGSLARGWLLKGAEGAPAVVFLHRYGADRSWLFNLGIKLNETTSSTILWPDLRGHGLNPPVSSTSFGSRESEDLLAALDFLRSLKGDKGSQLIGDRVGLYGVELGAYAAMQAANKDATVHVLVLDSVPQNSDQLVRTAVSEEIGLKNQAFQTLTCGAARIYFLGRYENKPACDLAAGLKTQRILLLAGADDGPLRDSTVALQHCFQSPGNVEAKTDLPLTGFTLPSATGEQGEGYDRPVIDFFLKNLR
jgi:pimeloyl-ACP methyl ester carboxylesterase